MIINYLFKNYEDLVPPILIKKCNFIFSYLLDILYKSFSQRKWKSAFVIPIHKCGDKKIISNYRPVSVMNTFPILFDGISVNLIKPTFSIL